MVFGEQGRNQGQGLEKVEVCILQRHKSASRSLEKSKVEMLPRLAAEMPEASTREMPTMPKSPLQDS